MSVPSVPPVPVLAARLRAAPRQCRLRLRAVAVPLMQAAIAAGIAWELARLLHPRPIFAPISALISMRAAVGRRGQQALHLIFGITVGILIAEGLVRLLGAGAWQLALAVLIGMAIPAAAGMPPLVVTQSAVWCILVVALGPHSGSYAVGRFIDGLIGGGVALVLVQLVFPADPYVLAARAARPVYEEVASILEMIGDALAARDERAVRAALERTERFDDSRLRESLDAARLIVRRSPRRRRRRAWVAPYVAAGERLDAVERDLVILAVAALRRVREGAPVSSQVIDATHRLAHAYRALPELLDPSDRDPVSPALAEVEATLRRLGASDGFAETMLVQQLEALTRDARGSGGEQRRSTHRRP